MNNLFDSLWDDIHEKDQYNNVKPFLAHYTSIEIFESILKNNEFWFSNPLFMNDWSEVKYVMSKAISLISNDEAIKAACGTDERYHEFREQFMGYYYQFANELIMDTYIFCLAEHDKENTDGALSMWRGYGCNGNGIALILDAAKIGYIEESPFILAQVHYAPESELIEKIKSIISKFVIILASSNIPKDKLYEASYHLFERIKLLSLFVKHKGFEEEKEWRIVYLKDRDRDNKVTPMIDYLIKSNNVEPKLKLKLDPIDGVTPDDLSLTTIVDQIILGPSISSPITKEAVCRMLTKHNKSDLTNRVYTSEIPYRGR